MCEVNEKSDIKETINVQLQELQMFMRRATFNKRGRMHNPYRGQGRVLAILKLKPEISQKELKFLLNMSKQAVTELIMKLEKSGYITREQSEDDKRVMIIKLTEEGAKAEKDGLVYGLEMSQMLDCLEDEEKANFSEYLARIINQYEDQYPDEDFDKRREKMKEFHKHYGHRGMHKHGGRRGAGRCVPEYNCKDDNPDEPDATNDGDIK